MTAAVLMGIGAFLWLAGELYAVFRDETTTTAYIRHFQHKWPWFRLAMWIFLAWLVGHFEFSVLGMRWQGPV